MFNSIFFDDFLALARKDEELEFEQVPFDHPLFIMYSSGTTGRPKCLVHSVGVGSRACKLNLLCHVHLSHSH